MEKKEKWFYTSMLFLFLAFSAQAQSKKITADEYIATFKELAISEMKRTGIPASITLAQGLLESGNGNSELAKQSNNHFGIKCKKDWTGRTVNYDDDAPQECFRAYDKPEDSYIDHSNFLVNGARYASLFELDATDYKAWAKGLKDAGYATNPKYPELLISAIERYSLFQYDLGNKRVPKENKQENIFAGEDKKQISNDIRTYNNIPVYVVKNGENYHTIAKKNKMMPWQITKYNDLSKGDKISEGTILYLKPKRRNAKGHDFHTVQDGENMYYLSQVYGIKLKHLYSKNLMEEGQEPAPGEKINLRKKRKSAPQLAKNNSYTNNGKRGLSTATKPQNQITENKQADQEKPVVKINNKEKKPVENKEKPLVQNTEVKPKETPKQQEINPTLYASEEKTAPITIKEEFNAAAEFHTVKEGENLEKIAFKYGVAENDIMLWNEMTDASLYPGQLVRVKGLKKNADNIKVVEKQLPDGNHVLYVENHEKLQSSSTQENIKVEEEEIEPTAPKVVKTEDFSAQIIDGYYTVQAGETLYSISHKLNVPLNKIHEMNNLEDNTVKKGQRIRVRPAKEEKPVSEQNMNISNLQYHEVQAGETLYSISRKYALSVDALKKLNGLTANTLSTGQQLKIKE